MGDYYDSNYYDYNEYEYDPNVDYDENEEYNAYLEEDDYEDEYANHNDNGVPYITEIWKQLRIQQESVYYIVNISNRGRVKPNTSKFQEAIASYGVQLRGTPYMVTHIGTRDYYIHELVWLAFVGPIDANYEVRHRSHYVLKTQHKTYCNRVECLELYLRTLAHVD